MRAGLLASSTLAALLAAACAGSGIPVVKRAASADSRQDAILLANAAAAQAGYDLSEFGEPTNTGRSGIADPQSPVWSFDYSTCGNKFVWDCKGFTVTVDKATGKAVALAWQ
jgi:hypothetical protein